MNKFVFKCANCKKPFRWVETTSLSVDDRQQYCSDRCRQRAYRARKKAGLTLPIKPPGYINVARYCQHCGQQMIVRSHTQKYCDERCRQRAYRIRHGQSPRRRPGRPVNKS